MRRAALVALLVALSSSFPLGQTPASDAVRRLLADLQNAISSGKVESFRALASPLLAPSAEDAFRRTQHAGAPTAVVLRERSRVEAGPVFRLLVEVFTAVDRSGRAATWRVAAQRTAAAPDRLEVVELKEMSALEDLSRLALDTTKQFAVRNLTFRGEDLTLTMASGTAFVAASQAGIAAMVLKGDGEIRFTPSSDTERGQLRAYGGKPEFVTRIESAFIRLHPSELEDRMAKDALTPAATVDPMELRRAQMLFDDLAPRSYTIDLRDLAPGRWSIEPPPGGIVIEFKSDRYGALTYVRSPRDAEDISLFDRAAQRNISIYSSAEAVASRGRFFSEDTTVPYDVEAYGLDLSFDPGRSTVSGHGLLRIRVKSSGVSTITLKLASSLNVTSVTSPSLGRLLALRTIGQNALVISLPAEVAKDTAFVLDIAYAGRLPPQQPDRETIELQDFTSDGLDPEPRFLYSGGVAWYPQSVVTDYAGATMRLSVPQAYNLVASGGPVPMESVPDAAPPKPGMRTYQFIADRPVRYLACVISRFQLTGRTRVDVPRIAPPIAGDAAAGPVQISLDVFASPRQASANRETTSSAAAMMRYYASIVGEAPYPHFTIAAVEDLVPGGHSPPLLALWKRPMATSNMTWSDDPAVFDRYPNFILAHEVVHQWWGAAVGVKNYHEQWLSEGLAQYFALMYTGVERGPEAMRTILILMRQSATDYGSRGPIYLGYRLAYLGVRGHVLRAIVYNKTAIVLHMLRRLIGEDAFMAGIRRYYREFRFKKAGIEDFRTVFEAETPIKLERFFERWVLGSNTAKARVTAQIDPGGLSASVKVEQIGEVFDYPLSVVVQYKDGHSENVTIPITSAVVDHRLSFKTPVRQVTAKDEFTLVNIGK